MYRAKMKHHFSNECYSDVSAIANGKDALSLYMVKKLVAKSVKFQYRDYPCCVKSHMCFRNNQLTCDECGEPAFYNDDPPRPRAIFRVFSLESRVRAWFGNRDMATALRYRHAYVSKPAWRQQRTLKDIFDGRAYRTLVQAGLFSGEIDIALMVAADGVRIFDRYVCKI
jgi:hypothetical protein